MESNKHFQDGEYSLKLGVEIHLTLNTTHKVFNFNNNGGYHEKNSIDYWELGYLGELPLLNYQVVRSAIKTSIFLNSQVSEKVIFDRKIYNYFDLSKGFQITQERKPIGINGYFTMIFNREEKKIPISRIQIEEDTAKSSYEGSTINLDFSRAGSPLLEIVTDPVFESNEQLISFLNQLRSSLVFLGVTDGRMELGQFRIDLNFSIKFSDKYQTPRFEIKNLNSIKNLRIAVEQQISFHLEIFKKALHNKIEICQLESQTLGFNELTQTAVSQRKKTTYYFVPEVNIPIIEVDQNSLKEISSEIKSSPSDVWKSVFSLVKTDNPLLLENPYLSRFISFFISDRQFLVSNLISLEIFFFKFLNKGLFSKVISHFYSMENNVRNFISLFELWNNKKVSPSETTSLVEKFVKNPGDSFQSVDKKEMSPQQLVSEIQILIKSSFFSRKISLQIEKKVGLIFSGLKRKFPSYSLNFVDVAPLIRKEIEN